jgi:hypothetical protein
MAAEGQKRRQNWNAHSVALATLIHKRLASEQVLEDLCHRHSIQTHLSTVKQDRLAYGSAVYNRLASEFGSDYQQLSYQSDFKTLINRVGDEAVILQTK